jgi:hypothetical protein
LGARSEHQRQLRQRRKAGGRRIQEEATYFLPSRGPTRLTRFHHGQSLRAKYAGQLFHLRALAATVEPLEGDELPEMLAGRHAEIINEQPVFRTSA